MTTDLGLERGLICQCLRLKNVTLRGISCVFMLLSNLTNFEYIKVGMFLEGCTLFLARVRVKSTAIDLPQDFFSY